MQIAHIDEKKNEKKTTLKRPQKYCKIDFSLRNLDGIL